MNRIRNVFLGLALALVTLELVAPAFAAKTVFAPMMQVPSVWLNKVFNHVHDGINEDGHAPLVDLTSCVTGVLPAENMEAWKAPVATLAALQALPGAGNTLGDIRMVTSDGTASNNVPWYCTGTGTQGWSKAQAAAGDTYDSGWFSVATSNTYTKAHGLGAAPRQVIILGRKDGTATGWDFMQYDDGNNDYRWGAVSGANATNVVIKTATGGVANRICNNGPATGVSGFAGTETTGEYRIIAIK